MKNLFFSLAVLAGMIASAQCGCGQQVPKPSKGLIFLQDDTGGQSIDKGKKLDLTPAVALQFATEQKFVSDTGGRGQTVDPGKKYDLLALDTGGVKLPPEGKKYDWASNDTGGVKMPKEVKKYDLYDTGGTIPAGAGKKYDFFSA